MGFASLWSKAELPGPAQVLSTLFFSVWRPRSKDEKGFREGFLKSGLLAPDVGFFVLWLGASSPALLSGSHFSKD